jgi:hypothetical protein
MILYAFHYAPRSRSPFSKRVQRIARQLKTADPKAIREAAPVMAMLLDDAPLWLIPVPSSTGSTGANLALCRAIRAYLPNARIVQGIARSRPVESSCERRRIGLPGLTVPQHHFRRSCKPLLNLPVWFVDNVVTTGTTFKAARLAFGLGHGIAFADASSPSTARNPQPA